MQRHDLLHNDIITYLEFKALFLDFTDIESVKNLSFKATMVRLIRISNLQTVDK